MLLAAHASVLGVTVPAADERRVLADRLSFRDSKIFHEALLHIDAPGSAEAGDASVAARFWQELFSERWSIVDASEREGRRYYLALLEDAETATPSQLTLAERRVFGCAQLGWSNKLVAFSLGISRSTVATLLARARKKLARQSDRNKAQVLFANARGICSDSRQNLRVTRISDRLMLISISIASKPDELAASALSTSEKSVVELALSGLSNAAIAHERRSSPRTIANQLASAYKKLGVGGRRELWAKFGR